MPTSRQTKKHVLDIVNAYELNEIAPPISRQSIKNQQGRLPRALNMMLRDFIQHLDMPTPIVNGNGYVTVPTKHPIAASKRQVLDAYAYKPIKPDDLGFILSPQDAIRLLRDYASSKKPFDVD